VNAGEHRPPTHSPLRVPGACQFNGTFTGWHPGAGGAKRSETERASDPAVSWYARTRAMTDETSQASRLLRESKDWGRARMTRRRGQPGHLPMRAHLASAPAGAR
jgi:hypothetical protein